MERFLAHLPVLETVLWILAGVAAFAAFLVFVPTFFGGPPATPVARVGDTPRPTLTPVATFTGVISPPAPVSVTPLAMPTPPPGARVFDFLSDTRRGAWLGSGDSQPHWGDRNVHAGRYQGQTFQSVLYFDMAALAPGSQIVYAQVQLTGLSRSNIGSQGSWSLHLLPASLLADWTGRTAKDFDAATQAQIGPSVGPAALAEGQTNQFVFSSEQLGLLNQAIDGSGAVGFRLDGPTGPSDSLFTWDGGDPDPTVTGHPTLRVIAVPAQFVEITNTPTPQNVLTAAAAIAQGTQSAQLYGTPTPLPRQFATVLPLVAITTVPTPANSATAAVRSDYATAVAMTTGTFTPTPSNWVTTTPTPPFLSIPDFTPFPTIAPTPETSRLEQLSTPIPTQSGLYGNIAFQTDREGAGTQNVWIMNPEGVVLGKLNGDEFYHVAETRTLFSPDKLFQVDVGKNDNGLWQIVILDVAKGTVTPLITESTTRKVGVGSYHPEWSPLGDKIAFISDRAGTDEVFTYDVKTKAITRLTITDRNPKTNEWAQNKHPSWSPDGKQIVFSSNREPYPRWQLWIMNADGSGLRLLSPSPYNDTNAVWIR
ncbi:MAG: hypothetical protein M1482_07790 [Chloroflexi bacterium]|nr:hypothetical protein [Chloroflexota bacterium]